MHTCLKLASYMDTSNLNDCIRISNLQCTKNTYSRIWKHLSNYTNNRSYSPQAWWRLMNNRFNFVLEIVQQYSLHLRQTNIKCTVLCKSNATEMREFCFLFKWTFVEIPCESSSDNLRLFEQKFRWTKSAVSLNVCFETKVQRNFVIKSVSLLPE